MLPVRTNSVILKVLLLLAFGANFAIIVMCDRLLTTETVLKLNVSQEICLL